MRNMSAVMTLGLVAAVPAACVRPAVGETSAAAPMRIGVDESRGVAQLKEFETEGLLGVAREAGVVLIVSKAGPLRRTRARSEGLTTCKALSSGREVA
jgi:hypothetical protein